MLDHLLELEDPEYAPEVASDPVAGFTPAEKLGSNAMVDAKMGTAEFYTALGVVDDDEITNQMAQEQAAATFVAFATGDEAARLVAASALSLPQSVKSSVAMLTQYQWNFVEQANELRSMAVSKIVKETDNPNANIRLKALQMLGNITEVALFTERVEIKKTDVSASSIEELIREKLQRFAALAAPVEDIAFVDAPKVAETVEKARAAQTEANP
jgi:ABC-type glycerol-3-phosphate transport system substrate-binding protein